MITKFSKELSKFIRFMADKRLLTHYPIYQLEKECGLKSGELGHRRSKPQINQRIVDTVVIFANEQGYQFDISYFEKWGTYYVEHK